MNVSHISVKNFKSFKDLSIDLNPKNVIIGECSSGKSNFVEIFEFLKDISFDFENGLIEHGGKDLINCK